MTDQKPATAPASVTPASDDRIERIKCAPVEKAGDGCRHAGKGGVCCLDCYLALRAENEKLRAQVTGYEFYDIQHYPTSRTGKHDPLACVGCLRAEVERLKPHEGLWDKHQAIRLNLQKETWDAQCISRDLEAERDALRAELAAIKAQASDATEYVLAVENRELRAEVGRLNYKADQTLKAWQESQAELAQAKVAQRQLDSNIVVLGKLREAQAREEIATRKAEFESLSQTIKQLAAAREEISRLGGVFDQYTAVIQSLNDSLAAEKAARSRDAEVFRGQLGYAVQEGCAKTLQDGTLPENVLAKSLKQYWDAAKAQVRKYEDLLADIASRQEDGIAEGRSILAARKGESK